LIGLGVEDAGGNTRQLAMKACPQCHLRYPADAVYCFLDGSGLDETRDPLIGATLAGRYVVEQVIGQGGMATVYRARHKLGDRPCAIKVMNRVLAADPTVRERFRREAKSVKTLAHPNVVEIYDDGETFEGTPYMVMELLDGQTLAELLLEGAVPLTRAMPLLIQLARGIARAHDLGVVHRDLKPENVFLCRRADGTDLVKILDFGIARSQGDPRLTNAGELFGTPQYMAPERVNSGEAGPSVDLYALGVLFYEVVTGKLPFEASDPTSYLVKHMQERPPPPRLLDPSLPAPLDGLIMQLLEKDPRARPVDAHRVAQDLLSLAAAIGAPIPPDPDKDPASSLQFRLSLPSMSMEPSGDWASRVAVFEQMLPLSRSARSSGTTQPGRSRDWSELERSVAEMKDLVAQLGEARRASALEQRRLEEIDARGREGRQRFGFAVDALGLDTSRARDELRAARIDFDRLAHQSKRAASAYATTQRELISWEGRSGHEEPHVQLAEAYRQCAEAVEEWIGARRVESSARAALEEKERTATDLDYQIAQLRGALASHEHAIEEQRATAHERLLEANSRAEHIEGRLVAAATLFCEPLRARPELGPLFRRLETEAASSR
jgi:serine/threonine-protein kinase